MDPFELMFLADFLGENWSAFLQFMDERGYDEARCEDFANKLDKAAGRG